ncbi:MAG: 2-phospho-L-lactate guanylyltransferase [Alphaproteobacteria bacterium]|nr:2-phospho-L-lactate guanylyltransferase [Alphaproteobacteria bacterium]
MIEADVQVIVPAKRLAEAKSRLRPVLGDADREALVLDMLGRVIAAARGARRVAFVAVVTSDARIGRLAQARGARTLTDSGHDLNSSLSMAMQDPQIALGPACLILPGDLPRLTADAVDGLLAWIEAPGRMVIAPDQHLAGTNALAWRGASYDGFRFGPGSFIAHRDAGRAAGFTVVAQPVRPEFFDLDDIDGLARIEGFPRLVPRTSRVREAKAHA